MAWVPPSRHSGAYASLLPERPAQEVRVFKRQRGGRPEWESYFDVEFSRGSDDGPAVVIGPLNVDVSTLSVECHRRCPGAGGASTFSAAPLAAWTPEFTILRDGEPWLEISSILNAEHETMIQLRPSPACEGASPVITTPVETL